MARVAYKKPQISLGGVDISNYVSQASVRWEETNVQESVTAGEDWAAQSPSGKKRASAELGFVVNNFTEADALETIMQPLLPTPYGTSTEDVQQLIIKPATGAISPTNPGFTGNVVINSWQPLGGGMVGSVLTATHTWPIDGQLERDITP